LLVGRDADGDAVVGLVPETYGFVRLLLFRSAVALTLCVPAEESLGATVPPHDFHTYRPSVVAVRIAPSEAPTIDGLLDDPVWKKSASIDEFYQLEPNEGQPGDERTRVRILYDENNLYFAITCYDDEPEQIKARVKARDGDLENDDFIRVYLDPYLTRRNGYFFDVNPLGARREVLLQNNSDTLTAWNALWTAKARKTPDGWTVEMAIPFRSISYDRNRTVWGFDFYRLVRRKDEKIRWSSINKAIDTTDTSEEGTLKGITGIREGLGLDLQTFVNLRYTHNWDTSDGNGISIRPSGNAFYKITPSLTGTLTYNTDFSDAPLDERQVNITRFDLFYPERRDFFLQDAPSFEFGGINISDDPNGGPFFSRNIGIVNGNPVNILVGGKVSGEQDNYDIGAMTVRTAGGAGVAPQDLSVLRVSEPVLDESKVGVILTNGDPTGATQNTAAGTDFQFHDSNIFEGNTLVADSFYERSFSSSVGQDDAFGLALDFPNEPWDATLRFKELGGNFAPALGFADRPGIREYEDHIFRRDRYTDNFFRWIDAGIASDLITGLDNQIQTQIVRGAITALTDAGDKFRVETWNDYENTPEFLLPHNVPIPAGEYQWQVYHARVETALERSVSGIFDVQCCGFYNGQMLQTDTTITVLPNELVSLIGHHTLQVIHLPTGHVTIHVGSVDFALNFTPDMQLLTQVEYDNISHDMQLSARYRWEFLPGSELLVVLGNDAVFNSYSHQDRNTTLSIRLGHTFRL
jgi:hypothetical protein